MRSQIRWTERGKEKGLIKEEKTKEGEGEKKNNKEEEKGE